MKEKQSLQMESAQNWLRTKYARCIYVEFKRSRIGNLLVDRRVWQISSTTVRYWPWLHHKCFFVVGRPANIKNIFSPELYGAFSHNIHTLVQQYQLKCKNESRAVIHSMRNAAKCTKSVSNINGWRQFNVSVGIRIGIESKNIN